MKFLTSVFGLLLIVFSSYSQKYYVYWGNHVGFTTGPSGGSPYITEIDQESWSVLNGCAGDLYATPTSNGIFSIDALPKALSYDRKLRSYSVPGGRISIQTLSFHYLHEVSNLSMGVITTYNIDNNTNPGFNCSFSGLNVSGSVEMGISPPTPSNVFTYNSAWRDVPAELEGKQITLSLYYYPVDFNTNSPISNFTYEIQISSDNGTTWSTYCSGQPLDGTVPYTLPDVISGSTMTLLFRSRIHRTNGVDPVAYSPWSVPKTFTVCDFPDVTITPTSSKCVGVNGGLTTITFNVGSFDISLKYIDIFYVTTKDGLPWDEPLINPHTITAGDTYTSLPMAAGTYTIKIRAKDIFDGKNTITYTINQPPAAPSYTSGSLTPCVNSTQTYTVTSVGADSYSWTIPPDLTLGGNGNTNSETIKFGSTSGSKIIKVTPLSNTCTAAIPAVLELNVNVIPLPTVNISVTETSGIVNNDGIICNGASATLTATGGTSYSWSPSTGLSATNIAAPVATPSVTTTYEVTVTNSNGCSSKKSQTITVNSLPTANISVTETSGTTNNDGIICIGASATLTASGGTSYSWSPSTGLSATNIASPIATPSATTTYEVTVTNSNGCSSKKSQTITVNSLPIANISVTETSGITNNDGSICNGASATLTATGGISYSWSPSTGLSATNIASPISNPSSTTTYTVLVTDGNGCKTTANKVLTVMPLPNNSSTLSDPIICKGQPATITQSGSENGFIYQLQLASNSDNMGDPVTGTGSSISYSVSPTSTTNYKVVVTNNITNCSVTLTDQSTVTVNLLPTPTLVGPTIACANISGNVYQTEPDMTGYLWSVSGGTITSGGTINSNSATVTWNAGGDAGTGAGSISVNYKNANGCYASSEKNLNVTISNLYFSNPTITHVKCNGDNTGVIVIEANGGSVPYTYTLKRGNTTVTSNSTGNFTGLSAASDYTVTATDINSCSVTSDNISINQPAAILINPNSITHVNCFGFNTGAIALIVTGGTNPLSYIWSSPSGYSSNSKNISGLIAGLYTIKVTDVYNCTNESTFEVLQPASPLVFGSPSLTNIDCYGSSTGQIAITASGGTSPYSYTLTGGGIIPKTNADGLFTNLPAATDYSITVTDKNLCTTTLGGITIAQPSEPFILSVNSFENVKCPSGSDGSVALKISGGIPNYKFSMDESDWISLAYPYEFKNLIANSYTFWAEDSKGCQTSVNQTITQPDPITPITVISNVICKGESSGKLSFSVIGGTGLYNLALIGTDSYNHAESSVAQKVDFSNLAFGRYTLSISDSKNCELKDLKYDILEPSIPLSFTEIPQDPRCKDFSDGEIQVTPAGGWGRLSYSFANLPSGITYTNGKYSGLRKGVFSINLADSLGCIYSKDVTLAEPTLLTLSTPIITNLLCNGDKTGSIEVTAEGGTPNYNYVLTGGRFVPKASLDGKFSNLPARSPYLITVTDNNGCTAVRQTLITEPETLKLNLSNTRDDGLSVNCTGGVDSVWVTPQGGTAPFTLTLLGQAHNCLPTYTIRNLENGRYPLSLTDSHGCIANSIAVISNLPSPKIRVKSIIDAKCSYSNDGRIDVETSTLTHSVIVKWSPGYNQEGETLNNVIGGSYTAHAIDEYGCTHDTTIIVGAPSPIVIESIDKQNPICFGSTNGLLKVSASGGNLSPFNYLWTNDFTGFAISNTSSTGEIPSGKYAVNVTDSKGCEAKTSYVLVDPPLLKPNLPSIITICSNQTYYADAGIPNVNYLWYSENGFRSNNRTVSLSTSGIYNLLVTDSKGCSGRDTLNLVKSENIIDANFMIADKASVGDTLVLIEMSWPIPQTIEWHYPASFMPIYHNDYSVYLVPQMIGSFNIGLTSFVSACSEYIEKAIIIEPTKDKKNKTISKQSILRDVIAYPNPNRGDFSVEIALNRESDVLVEVYSTYGKRLFAKNGKGLTNYKIDINLFQTPGIYLVRITVGNEFRSLRVVVE